MKHLRQIKLFIWSICFVMSGMLVFSQEKTPAVQQNWNRFIHIESGFLYPGGTIKESIAIRQNISSFYVDQYSRGYIFSETSGFIFGIRWEYFNNKFKTGVSTGLRYSGFKTEIFGFSSSVSDFFYLRYTIQDSDTKFARVNSITETKSFISLPLELRTMPFEIKKLGFFVRAGVEFSLMNLGKSTSIEFKEKSMNLYHDEILNNIGTNTNKFYSSLYASAGMKFGKAGRPTYIFEVYFPSLILTKNNFVLSEIDYFEGFKLSVQLPVQKQAKNL